MFSLHHREAEVKLKTDNVLLERQPQEYITKSTSIWGSISILRPPFEEEANKLLSDSRIAYLYSLFSRTTPQIPDSLNSSDLPPELQELDKIQQIIANYNSDDENQTKELLNFINNNPNLGLNELHICMNIRPRLIRHYVKLYTRLPTNIRTLARQLLPTTRLFSNTLLLEDPSRLYEVKTFTKSNSNIISIANLIFSFANRDSEIQDVTQKMIDGFLNDDPDTFLQLDPNITSYRYDKCVCTLLDWFALFGAVKCFKVFFLNTAEPKCSEIFAIAGGNFEIVRILAQKGKEFHNGIHIALYYRQEEMFTWLSENYAELQNNKYSLLTQTMSIRALYALSKTNQFSNFIDLIANAILDERFDICKYFVKHSIFHASLFLFISNEKFLKTFLSIVPTAFLPELFRYLLENRAEWHLRLALMNIKLEELNFQQIYYDKIISQFPDLAKIFEERSNKQVPPEESYIAFPRRQPIAKVNVYPLIMYCIKKMYFAQVHELAKQYFKSLSFEEIIEICKIYPVITTTFDGCYNFKDLNNEILLIFLRYYVYNSSISFSRSGPEIMKNALELCELMNPFDFINLTYFLSEDSTVFKAFVQKGYLKYDERLTSHDDLFDYKRNVREKIIQSTQFKEYFASHKEEIGSYLYQTYSLINLFSPDEEISEKFYEILLRCGIVIFRDLFFVHHYEKCMKTLISLLTNKYNRKYINIKALAENEYNFKFLANIIGNNSFHE